MLGQQREKHLVCTQLLVVTLWGQLPYTRLGEGSYSCSSGQIQINHCLRAVIQCVRSKWPIFEEPTKVCKSSLANISNALPHSLVSNIVQYFQLPAVALQHTFCYNEDRHRAFTCFFSCGCKDLLFRLSPKRPPGSPAITNGAAPLVPATAAAHATAFTAVENLIKSEGFCFPELEALAATWDCSCRLDQLSFSIDSTFCVAAVLLSVTAICAPVLP